MDADPRVRPAEPKCVVIDRHLQLSGSFSRLSGRLKFSNLSTLINHNSVNYDGILIFIIPFDSP